MIGQGIIVILAVTGVMFLTSWLLPTMKIGKLVNDSTDAEGHHTMVKSARSIDWMQGSAIGSHWIGFNVLSAFLAIIVSTIVFISPFSDALWRQDRIAWYLLIVVSTVIGYHLVWSTTLDWRFHKIPRWPLVVHMILMLTASTMLTSLSADLKWLTVSVVIIGVMCWLIGTVPGSGMSDGRMYVIISASVIPFMASTAFLPLLVSAVLAIINAVIVAVGPGRRVSQSDTTVPVMQRIMKTGSPMGPFVMISFTIAMIMLSYGVISSPITAMMGM
jgi:hypothetical protein